MRTTAVTDRAYYRECTVCGFEEILPRAGKLWVGYSLEAETKRDFDRREHAKDLLQPKDRQGKIDPLYDHAYGNPYKKAEVGTTIEKFQIKESKHAK